MNIFKPDMYVNDIYNINYKRLFSMNKKYLFFDLDNTIISYIDSDVNDNIMNLFNDLKKMGFECFIFSNSNNKRLYKIKEKLNVEVFCNSMKPLKKNYMKVLKKYDKDKCVFIGDQLMTDVLGAKRNSLYVILVDRINDKEPIYTKFWRFFENFVLKKYEKDNVFKKGKYYE